MQISGRILRVQKGHNRYPDFGNWRTPGLFAVLTALLMIGYVVRHCACSAAVVPSE